MTEHPVSVDAGGRDSRKRPSSSSSYNNVYVRNKQGRLLLTVDEGLFFQPQQQQQQQQQDENSISTNERTTDTRICIFRWCQLQTMTANVATSPTALLKFTISAGSCSSNSKKILVKFASRSQLEEARREIQDRWKLWRHNHNNDIRSERHTAILDQSDQEFSESHRSGGGDEATFANQTYPLGGSVIRTTGVESVSSHCSPDNNSNTIRSSDRPILRVLPHNQILLSQLQPQQHHQIQQQSNPPGHYILDFSNFEERQLIQVTLVSHDVQGEEQDDGVVGNTIDSYMLSLNRPHNHLQERRINASGNIHEAPSCVQGQPQYNNSAAALQREKLQALQRPSSSVALVATELPSNPAAANSSDDMAVIDGYRISKQQCIVITTVTVACICILLVTTVVLVIILAVKVWNDNDNDTTGGSGSSVFRDDDFYAGFNNNNNE